jgi:flagellar biosynthetic protein FlhB
MSDSSDRVIPATPRRREEARRHGAMPTAALPAWVAGAGTAVLLLPAWAAATMTPAVEMLRAAIASAAVPAVGGRDAALPPIVPVVLPTVAVILAAAAAGLGVRLLLDGVTWQPARILPTFRRIDPGAGLARIFSFRTVGEALGNALGFVLLAAAAGAAVGPLVAVSATVRGLAEPAVVAAAAWRSAAWLFAAAAIIAAVRWILARQRFERSIRMTAEEFAAEAKSSQADPKVRLLQRDRRRQTSAGAA